MNSNLVLRNCYFFLGATIFTQLGNIDVKIWLRQEKSNLFFGYKTLVFLRLNKNVLCNDDTLACQN